MLLDPREASALTVDGATDSAVLVALYVDGHGEPTVVLTRRRADLRRHAGEVSFPGGRHDDADPDLVATALREAWEEVGMDPAGVEVVGALQPVPTIATGYAIYPFVGLIDAGLAWTLSEREVEQVLELRLRDLRAGAARRRIERRGVPFLTDTYVVGEDLVWGATARILQDLLGRLDRLDAGG